MDSNHTLSAIMKKVIVPIAIILPLILVFFFVCKFGVTIPYWDQWELVPLLEKIHNHTLTLADVWAQHNEHRIFFPEMVMLILARLSGWNIFLELCTSMLLATFTFLFLLSILGSTSKTTSPWLKIFLSLMIFSMVQYENWGWGWQIQVFMSVLGLVIAIWAANKWQGKTVGLIIAISGAVLSSYSFNTGLASWPAVLFVMLLQKKWKLKHIIIWTFACIATILLYYYEYANPTEHPSVLLFLSYPLIYIRYVLTYLGASLGWTYPISLAVTIISLVLISLAIFNLWRFDKQKLSDMAPWIAMALYACMAACATGVGRIGFSWEQAFSSRYTTISLLLPLSAGVLLQHSIRFYPDMKNKFLKSLFLMVIIFIFIILYTNSYRSGLERMKVKSIYVNASAFCLTHPDTADEYFLNRLYPRSYVVRPRIKTLSELGIKFKTGE